MSVIERIKQIQREGDEKSAKENDAQQKILDAERIKQEGAKNKEIRAFVERRDFVISQTEKVFGTSGLLDVFQKIDKELLQNKPTHKLAYAPAKGKIALLWGSGESKNIELNAGGDIYWQERNADCNFASIEAEVDVDREILTISGENTYKFEKDDWENTQKIEDALVDVYTHPKTYYSSHSDIPYERDLWGGSGPTN